MMAFFLKEHSVEKIMVLGRWSTNAFLITYIRPQVLEWTNIMARDIARNWNFRDLNRSQSDKRYNGTMPGFHL